MSAHDAKILFRSAIIGSPIDPNKRPSTVGSVEAFDALSDAVTDVEATAADALAALDAVQTTADSIIKATWAALTAIAGTRNGQRGLVPTSDAGTHTDPVVGGTVSNSGTFAWSTSPAGWQRVDVYQDVASLTADVATALQQVDLDRVERMLRGEKRAVAWLFDRHTPVVAIRDDAEPTHNSHGVASVTCSRANAAWYFDAITGLLGSVAANTARYGRIDNGASAVAGIIQEQARTNIVKHNRDLRITHDLVVTGGAGTFTDGETVTATGGGSGTYVADQSPSGFIAVRSGSGTFTGTLTGGSSGATKTISSVSTAWALANVTVARNQTGLDGVANSASKITATAGNGTVLQAITNSSSARWQSAYLRRVTGTGTVYMTMDGGATWRDITALLTSNWTLVEIATQTITNPSVGFKLGTNGDAIAVDAVQNENNGTAGSSPILTTTAAVARAADQLSVALSGLPWSGQGAIFAEFATRQASNLVRVALQLDDGGSTNKILLAAANTGTGQGQVVVTTSSTDVADVRSGATAVAATARIAARVMPNDVQIATNGELGTVDITAALPTTTTVRFGPTADGVISRVVLTDRAIGADELKHLSLYGWPSGTAEDQAANLGAAKLVTDRLTCPWQGQRIAILGTSITDIGNYTAPLATLGAFDLVNMGYSGGALATTASTNPGVILDRADLIPDDVQLVIWDGLINDFRTESTLGALGDVVTSTFYGALLTTTLNLLARSPSRVVVFCTPYGTADLAFTGRWNNPNGKGNTLAQFQQAIRDVAHRVGMPVIEFAESGLGGANITIYSDDLLHPNTAGGTLMSQFIYDKLCAIRPSTVSPVALPTFTYNAGTGEVSIACATAGATIYYTTDGSIPTTASALYSTPFTVSSAASTVVNALAVATGYAPRVSRGEFTRAQSGPGSGTWMLRPAVLGDLSGNGLTPASLTGGLMGGVETLFDGFYSYAYSALWLAVGASNAVEFMIANKSALWMALSDGASGWYAIGEFAATPVATGSRFSTGAGAITAAPNPGSFAHTAAKRHTKFRLARRGDIVEIYQWNGTSWDTVTSTLDLSALSGIAGYYANAKLGILQHRNGSFSTVKNVRVGTLT
jgi:hypothetical protein